MDNLAHSLAGAALGRAGLYKRTRLAAGALIIGANLPDLDAFGLLFGHNLAFRRGITHGPIAMLVLPLMLTAALLLYARVRPLRGTSETVPLVPSQLLLLSYIGVFSHPVLDWLNSYGVRLLYPFSDRWFYGDSIFIVDPFIWIALGAGVWLSRKRWSKLAQSGALYVFGPSRSALALVTTYVLLMIFGSVYARKSIQNAMSHSHVDATSVMAAPVPLNPTVRAVVVSTQGEYTLGRFRFFSHPRFVADRQIVKNDTSSIVKRALSTGEFDDFLYWSRFPFYVVHQQGDSAVVTIGDARFPVMSGDRIRNTFSRSITVER